MKAFILCGGNGTRLDGEGKIKPKALVKIGNKPILIHLINSLIKNDIKEFVLCLGYKKKKIIDYFLSKYKILFKNNVSNKYQIISLKLFNQTVVIHFVDTEKDSGTGGRIKIANKIIKNKYAFLMTYCDGLANINISNLIKLYKKKKKLVALTAVQPQHRYGVIKINKSIVTSMNNNNPKQNIWINGGYFLINPLALKLIKNKNTFWEQEPLNKLIKSKNLVSYIHKGFWESMDTQKDKIKLNNIWKKNKNAWL